MINISFKSKTPDPMNEILEDVKLDQEKLRNQADQLGIETVQQLHAIIDEGRVRPQGDSKTLQNNLIVEFFETGWGIGDIDKLNVNAPFWAALNFGSSHMVGKKLPPGSFAPGVPNPTSSDFRKGRWQKGQAGSLGGKLFSPIVTKPIQPTNYIEKTVFWLSNKFKQLKG